MNGFTHRIGIVLILALLFGPQKSGAQTNGWSMRTRMPTARLGLAACVIDGRIYAVGGYVRAGEDGLTVLEVYDPMSDTWTMRAPMPTGRRWLACGVLDGRLFVIGGFEAQGSPPLKTVEIYDPHSDSWSTGTPMLTARKGLTASVANGKLYAIAGANQSDQALNSIEEYDPVSDVWSIRASMPSSRAMIAAATVDGVIFVAGGALPGQPGWQTVQAFDPVSNSWEFKSDMDSGRWSPAMAEIAGLLYTVGGADGTTAHASMEIYDPGSNNWIAGPNMPADDGSGTGRRSGLAAVSVDGKLFVLGGTKSPAPPHPGIDLVQEYEAHPVNSENRDANVPEGVSLETAYPNPSRSSFRIPFHLAEPQEVTFSVVDVLGRIVWSQHSFVHSGKNELVFHGPQFLPAGTYLYDLKTIHERRHGVLQIAPK